MKDSQYMHKTTHTEIYIIIIHESSRIDRHTDSSSIHTLIHPQRYYDIEKQT